MTPELFNLSDYAPAYGTGTRPSVAALLAAARREVSADKIRSPSDALPFLLPYATASRERFFVLDLDGAHAVKRCRIVTQGLVNRTIVHPREVFGPAISASACAIIIAHNHPSGSTDPSPEDQEITKRLIDAGNILGIPVLDHIVFSTAGYLSFVQCGLMPTPSLD